MNVVVGTKGSLELTNRFSVFSKSNIGSPPVMPVPVAFMARPSSMTSSQLVQRRSLANMSGVSRRFSEGGSNRSPSGTFR